MLFFEKKHAFSLIFSPRCNSIYDFFVNVVDNLNLDSYGGGYAVFGKVIEGMETVDKIRNVPTTTKYPRFYP